MISLILSDLYTNCEQASLKIIEMNVELFLKSIPYFYKYQKLYKKYGFWGILLMALSIFSIIAGIIVTIIFVQKISLLYSVIKPGEKIDLNSTGMIGDFFGGVVGTIWSFAGVLLFFLALRLQSKELSLQIKELKDTREVFTTQQFENTFFNLLKTQQEIRQNLECDEIVNHFYINDIDCTNAKHYKSHLVFEYIKNYMINQHSDLLTTYKEIIEIKNKKPINQVHINIITKKLDTEFDVIDYENLSNPKTLAKTIYVKTFNNFHNQLGHYFRNLYHILNYLMENENIELSQLTWDELRGIKHSILINGKSIEKENIKRKYKKYSEFVQAQMSGDELFLLFYNGLFFSKMKKILHHYDFLENLSSDDLLNSEEDVKFYCEYNTKGVKMKEIKFKSRNQMLRI